MGRKLISSLTNRIRWKLISKAVVLGGVLLLADLLSLSFFAVVGFLFIALWVYLSSGADRRSFRFSFWLVQFVSLVALGEGVVPPLVVALVDAFLAFFSLGFFDSAFINEPFVYNLFSAGVSFSFFAVLFSGIPFFSNPSFPGVFFWFFFCFTVVYFLFREYARVFNLTGERRMRLLGGTFSLLGVEVSAVAAFLPLGFVNAAAFLTILFLIGKDLVTARENGLLNISFVFREVTIFVVVSSIIFATATWKI